MLLTTKIIKMHNIFFLLCLFVLQIAVANDEATASSQVAPYKITNIPIIKLLKAINYVSTYTMTHLDYCADECKCTVINKAPFFSILIFNYFLSLYLDIENSETLLYSAFTMLSISLLFSCCNTLMTPKECLQRISILFYGFYKYIFPIYSLAIISNSYTDKLGVNSYIPTFLFSMATLGSFILSNNNDDPFIENIPLLVIDSHLPVTPKMKLIKKIITSTNTTNDIFAYTGSLKLNDKDNLMSMLYKWTALHTEISLSLFSYIVVNNALQIPEVDEINKINQTIENLKKNNIKKEDITSNSLAIHPFYDNQLFLENCLQVNSLAEKCQSYQAAIIDNNQTLVLTHKELMLNFIRIEVAAINSDSLIDILNLYKAIVVESIEPSFTKYETMVKNKYQYCSILKNKDIYYLYFSLGIQNKNNFTLKTVNNFLKSSVYSLLFGINCFCLKNCLIVKNNNIDSLKKILTNAIQMISYNKHSTSIYAVSSTEDTKKNKKGKSKR